MTEVGPTDKPTTDLEAIKARCDAATPGPEWVWTYYDGHRALIQYGAPTDEVVLGISDDEPVDPIVLITHADAEFIAHAREDVPALIAEVERLRALLAPEEPARYVMDRLGTSWRHYNDVGWLRVTVTREPGIKTLRELDQRVGPLRRIVLGAPVGGGQP